MVERPKTVTELFPSKWLKASDLSKPVTVTISAADVEELRKPSGEMHSVLVLSFKGASKRLATNVTQCRAVAEILGSEAFADWIGGRVVLAPGVAQNGKGTVKVLPLSEAAGA